MISFKPGNLFACLTEIGNYVSLLEKRVNKDFNWVFVPTGTTMIYVTTNKDIRDIFVILNGKLTQIWKSDLKWQTLLT